MLERKDIQALITNLENLQKGEPEDILSELIENMKIQVMNEEYIDFLASKDALRQNMDISAQAYEAHTECPYPVFRDEICKYPSSPSYITNWLQQH